MTKSLTNTAIGLAIVLAIAVIYLLGSNTERAGAAAPSGIAATVATTSQVTTGTGALSIFATSTCSSRVITTAGHPIMLTFSDYSGQTPTASFGHIQATSTTVVYDASIYGCGLFKMITADGVSSLLTVTELR